MDIQQKQQEIEKELLDLIIQHLTSHQIDVPHASSLARDFLQILPMQNQEDLLMKLKTLGDKYDEVKQVYTIENAKILQQKEQDVISQMSSSIHAGNIEDAISVAKSLQNQH